MNIVNCAMLCAFVLRMPQRPDVQRLTDYTMSDAGGASDFVREYTLASGGPYCDCGYHKRNKQNKGSTAPA